MDLSPYHPMHRLLFVIIPVAVPEEAVAAGVGSQHINGCFSFGDK